MLGPQTLLSLYYVSAFEILAENVVPGQSSSPFVQQGYFLQVTNLTNMDTPVSVRFPNACPPLENYDPSISPAPATPLFADVIDENGNANIITTEFFQAPIGFGQILILANTTRLFGIQLISPTFSGTGSSRGLVTIEAPQGALLSVAATIRQVFTTNTANGVEYSASAYALPLNNGPVLAF